MVPKILKSGSDIEYEVYYGDNDHTPEIAKELNLSPLTVLYYRVKGEKLWIKWTKGDGCKFLEYLKTV